MHSRLPSRLAGVAGSYIFQQHQIAKFGCCKAAIAITFSSVRGSASAMINSTKKAQIGTCTVHRPEDLVTSRGSSGELGDLKAWRLQVQLSAVVKV